MSEGDRETGHHFQGLEQAEQCQYRASVLDRLNYIKRADREFDNDARVSARGRFIPDLDDQFFWMT